MNPSHDRIDLPPIDTGGKNTSLPGGSDRILLDDDDLPVPEAKEPIQQIPADDDLPVPDSSPSASAANPPSPDDILAAFEGSSERERNNLAAALTRGEPGEIQEAVEQQTQEAQPEPVPQTQDRETAPPSITRTPAAPRRGIPFPHRLEDAPEESPVSLVQKKLSAFLERKLTQIKPLAQEALEKTKARAGRTKRNLLEISKDTIKTLTDNRFLISQAGVFVATTALGVINPELARQIAQYSGLVRTGLTVGTVGLSVLESFLLKEGRLTENRAHALTIARRIASQAAASAFIASGGLRLGSEISPDVMGFVNTTIDRLEHLEPPHISLPFAHDQAPAEAPVTEATATHTLEPSATATHGPLEAANSTNTPAPEVSSNPTHTSSPTETTQPATATPEPTQTETPTIEPTSTHTFAPTETPTAVHTTATPEIDQLHHAATEPTPEAKSQPLTPEATTPIEHASDLNQPSHEETAPPIHADSHDLTRPHEPISHIQPETQQASAEPAPQTHTEPTIHVTASNQPVPGTPDEEVTHPSSAHFPATAPVSHEAPAPETNTHVPHYEVHGHTVSGSLTDGDLNFDGKPWHLLDNGVENLTHLIDMSGNERVIDQDQLLKALDQAKDLWARGELDQSSQPGLWNLFHLSNGTEGVFNSIMTNTDQTLSSLDKLGIFA